MSRSSVQVGSSAPFFLRDFGTLRQFAFAELAERDAERKDRLKYLA